MVWPFIQQGSRTMQKPNSITFINHASILITGREKGLLSDPWYFGDAFHHGWRLLHENSFDEVEQVLNDTTHIWLSHEHPDHLSIEFLRRYHDQILARNILFIFQETKDNRVVSYLRQHGFSVYVAKNGETIELEPGFDIRIVKDEFYDSACLVNLDGTRIINLNDCPIRDVPNLEKFRDLYGTCDILLTQFSYAAWKGGKENKTWRQQAAQEKIVAVRNQAKVFQARTVIPFASFVWFAHVENFYLCDSVNLPNDVVKIYADEPFKTVFMRPFEVMDVKNPQTQDAASVDFWMQQYGALSLDKCVSYEESVPVPRLQEIFAEYCRRLGRDNWWSLIKLARLVPGLGAFEPVTVRLHDLDTNVTVDMANKTLEASQAEADVSMHSNMFAFLINNPFGFDTLTVNGCLEETRNGGFARLAKSLALENLNNIGLYLAPSILLNLDVVRLFLFRLVAVSKRMLRK